VTPEQLAEVSRLLGEGVSVAEVARRTRLSRNTVARVRDRATSAPRSAPAAPPSAPAVRDRASAEQVDWLAVLGVSRRELEAVTAKLLVDRGLTLEGWFARLVRVVAHDLLRDAPPAGEDRAPGHVLQAPRCPTCKGPVLVDQAGRRCINRGCGWTGRT
jgi:hypothetical protein